MSNTMTLLPHVKLRFNIDHPSLEESYILGYECALADIAEEDNPFASGTRESAQWVDGWWDAFYGEKPIFSAIPEESQEQSANDHIYLDHRDNFFLKFLEISGVLVVSAIVSYQLFELVA